MTAPRFDGLAVAWFAITRRKLAGALAAAIMMVAMGGVVAAPALAQSRTVDHPTSDQLSEYLHKHRLPMVGAQVSTTAGGVRQVMLYGFVATDFGKQDAAKKTRQYLRDSTVAVTNNIRVNPEIRQLKKAPAEQQPDDQNAAAPPATADWEHKMDDMLQRGGASPSNDPNLLPPN